MLRAIADIRAALRRRAYDMTAHAVEEMAEDGLDLVDVESAILTGEVVKTERDDPRGPRYTVQGSGADRETPVGLVCRFTDAGRLLIITVYEVT